ncbi:MULTISPECIES: LysM peptidoglycan-binding domain-containing protein [unclassified Dehalobacter]|jgi:Predicted glycosyl hydrolase|uniref:LysM peptidoglycan-binding domain-containing protein n=1 Tax=unclassified Dehalobacter TaxID=2635733 RepID=UPI00028A4FCA|nr:MULTISPECIES: LysM peptidoglycan-binding domain-containing protein [unclassified Dehalobacter]AFV01467.1 Spore cortex-lytic enzyme, N-acetylglucosaminidase SleL [Dehalobacter sp. DCA]AFV04504.1 spore peptidoglycan hydrolase (N-acetylglucosaminidase) [Dehalobacter sp. CF]MDJ0304996.1 LysM peptidoglycan-binding domain-containing protein [Dehalobacter sp.]
MLIHVVKANQTLDQIAITYRISPASIISVNGLVEPVQLLTGLALVIPTEDVLHTVKSGETLWRIAQTYGTTVQVILGNNQITNPANIYPGQLITIPARRHRVLAGETLWFIAQKYQVSLQNLIKVNNITNANLIYPGTVLIIPRKPRPTIDVNGYIYRFSQDAVATVNREAEHLTYLSPFAYLIREDGSLQTIDDLPLIQAAISKKVTPMMSITNFTSTTRGENLAHLVLTNTEAINRLLTNAINIMKEKGYRGLNIDFENVLPEDREAYNALLQTAVTRLHAEGFFVSTALAPKLSAEQRGLLYEAHDYPAHGRIVDFVVLMTYEWGWRGASPQAISPLNQIKRVLDYAASVIPREKIFFGFQIYARDWLLPHVSGQIAETFGMDEAMSRALRYHAEIQYDTVPQSPFYRYTDTQGNGHEVWFEDARSAQAKFDTVKAYGLRGISYWALAYPFPQNWALLEDNFTIRK